jgi:hypothetical protein
MTGSIIWAKGAIILGVYPTTFLPSITKDADVNRLDAEELSEIA